MCIFMLTTPAGETAHTILPNSMQTVSLDSNIVGIIQHMCTKRLGQQHQIDIFQRSTAARWKLKIEFISGESPVDVGLVLGQSPMHF